MVTNNLIVCYHCYHVWLLEVIIPIVFIVCYHDSPAPPSLLPTFDLALLTALLWLNQSF